MGSSVEKGKFPRDGRKNRPILILVNRSRVLAVADGEGHAYKVYGDGYDQYGSVCKKENMYNPNDYESYRTLSIVAVWHL